MILPLANVVGMWQQNVGDLLRETGLALMKTVMEEEVWQLSGIDHQQHEEQRAHRWGSEQGYYIVNVLKNELGAKVLPSKYFGGMRRGSKRWRSQRNCCRPAPTGSVF